jgi:hypothetical protein
MNRAVSERTLNPIQYLEMVREELSEGAYQERVLRNVED